MFADKLPNYIPNTAVTDAITSLNTDPSVVEVNILPSLIQIDSISALANSRLRVNGHRILSTHISTIVWCWHCCLYCIVIQRHCICVSSNYSCRGSYHNNNC